MLGKWWLPHCAAPLRCGELSRYNPATVGTNDTQPVGDTFVQPQSGTPFYFEDFTSNAITTKMRIGGGDSVNAVMSRPLGDFNFIVFGSENNDLLTGQGKRDRLYGGGAIRSTQCEMRTA